MKKNNMENNIIERNISKLGFPIGLVITKNNSYMEKNLLSIPKIGGRSKVVLTNKGLTHKTYNFSDHIKIYS